MKGAIQMNEELKKEDIETKEEKKKYENIKIDRIVFARKEEKGLHYNLSV